MTQPVAWVAGGATGLGVQVAHSLAAAGYRIMVNYRTSRDEADTLVRHLLQSGTDAVAVKGDMANEQDVTSIMKTIVSKWGRIDCLVCMAGPFLKKQRPLWELTTADWNDMIAGNLSTVFYAVKTVMPYMIEQKCGRIITCGFPHVEHTPAWSGFGAYAAAKTGVASLTKTLAEEAAPYGITVNMVCPGDIRHPYKQSSIAAARGKVTADNLVGRPGTGEDIGRVIRFLAHPDSDFITGAVIDVTGGFDPKEFRLP